MMARTSERGTWREPGTERGASMIEMAVVMPLMLLIVFGLIEFGVAFRDVLTVSNAVRDGTRLVSAKGNDPDADCVTLAATAGKLAVGVSLDNLERIEIFRADSAGNQLAGDTNVYRFTGTDFTDCADWTTLRETYPSIGRQVTVGSTALDIIGVRVVYRHDWITGFAMFNGSFDIDTSSINRIEPEVFE